MQSIPLFHCANIVVILLALGARCWADQETAESQNQSATADTSIQSEQTFEELTPEQERALEQLAADLAALEDRAFEQFVAIDDVGVAYQSLDIPALIDCALQLAQGERVLLRKHRSGITPETLLDLAINIAAKTKDSEAFERLTRAVDSLQLGDLRLQLGIATKLAAQPRDAANELGPHEWIRASIENAELLNSTANIDAIVAQLPDDLGDRQRKIITRLVREAKSRVMDTEVDETLAKLNAGSRYFTWTFTVAPRFVAEGRRINLDVTVTNNLSLVGPEPRELVIMSQNPWILRIAIKRNVSFPRNTILANFIFNTSVTAPNVTSSKSVGLRAYLYYHDYRGRRVPTQVLSQSVTIINR